MMNRVDYIAGHRCARSVLEQSMSLLSIIGGEQKVIEMMRRCAVDKPDSYAKGVNAFVSEVEDAISIRKMKARA